MARTALDDAPPRGGGAKKRRETTTQKGRAASQAAADAAATAADGDAAVGGGKSTDVIAQMQGREKRLKRELNARAQKFVKGTAVNPSKIADRKTKAHVRYAEALADQAATGAALHEKWLLPSTPGVMEAEGMERTYRFKQEEIAGAVDVNAARKAFDLTLPHLGPYCVDFTPNGRDLLIGGGEADARRVHARRA